MGKTQRLYMLYREQQKFMDDANDLNNWLSDINIKMCETNNTANVTEAGTSSNGIRICTVTLMKTMRRLLIRFTVTQVKPRV